jgi:hypothetical protein
VLLRDWYGLVDLELWKLDAGRGVLGVYGHERVWVVEEPEKLIITKLF